MRSPGERLFSAYLRQRRLLSDYEAVVGNRRPDFVVHHQSGDVACEVYEPTIRLPTGGSAFSSYPALRNAFKDRKYEQAKAAEDAGLPFVLVLARTNSDISFDPLIVTGAMFGDISMEFTVRLDKDAPPPDPKSRMVFGGGGRLQERQKRAVSAVAILTSFNPTLWRVLHTYRPRLARIGDGDPGRWSRREQRAASEIIDSTFDHCTATGVFDDSARVARLTVLHNPYATIPLSREAFGGPHDDQWDLAEDSQYTLTISAPRRWEIPT